MGIPISEFWRLAAESRLLPPGQCQQLEQQFGHVKGAAAVGNARTLAEWLISQNVISRYQSTILLAGRPGPFFYGEYKIYDRVEAGPLSGQFQAIHDPTGHPVVLKFFAGETVSQPQRWSQTAHRAMKAAAVVHPHWWRTFELVDLEQFKFVAVEDVAGQSLAQRLEAAGKLPPGEACRIAYQLALALDRAHEAGFTHGDVRPANIVLDQQSRAVLWCDAAQPPTAVQGDPSDAQLIARADYAAPELAKAGCDPLSDIYALGCTLYYALSGQPPFAGGDVPQKMARHATEAIRPLAAHGVPEPLEKS